MIFIKSINVNGTSILEFSIEDNVNAASITSFYSWLKRHAARQQPLRVLGTIHSLPGVADFKTFSTLAGINAQTFTHKGRYALLSNEDWIETLLPLGNFEMPGNAVKYFSKGARPRAIDWLLRSNEAASNTTSIGDLKVVHIEGSSVYRFTVDGKFNEAGLLALQNILNNEQREGKVNLLVNFKDFEGFTSIRAFMAGLKVDFAALGNVAKCAIVTNKAWIKAVAVVESAFIPGMVLKGFATEEAALRWLES